MSAGEKYRKRIRKLRRPGLLRLWRQIEAGHTPGWPAGTAFEYLVIRAFEIERAAVQYPYEIRITSQKIEQMDGAVYTNGLACLVESKDSGKAKDYDHIAGF